MELVRELVGAYQSFERHAALHIRREGLSPAEFDVLSTLGNTEGMTFKELGRRTLIYKTTLTGVIDRLERQGLVRRRPSTRDRRSMIAELTAEGDALFQRIFPEHIAWLAERLESLGCAEIDASVAALRRIRNLFQ
ncbi:MAG TPA: MarR family transcriptional regulator [Gammaproteobacteria bacterium]|nr:MarR family transcriptional regulator [Gammaproteobacteria bacterium]